MSHELIIKEIRMSKRISQNELARKAEISQGYLSELEKGLKSPTIRMLINIADILEVCPKDLIICNCEEE